MMFSDEARRAAGGRCFFFYCHFSSVPSTSSFSLFLLRFITFPRTKNHWYSASNGTCRANSSRWRTKFVQIRRRRVYMGCKMIGTMCSCWKFIDSTINNCERDITSGKWRSKKRIIMRKEAWSTLVILFSLYLIINCLILDYYIYRYINNTKFCWRKIPRP